MFKLKFVTLTIIGCSLGFFGSIDLNRALSPPVITEVIELTISKAHAARRRGHHRRTTRRVARRTRHRAIRRASLPRRCVWRAPYHYCRGVYYQPIVVSGTRVYIVVNP